jgi:hypothetical protein
MSDIDVLYRKIASVFTTEYVMYAACANVPDSDDIFFNPDRVDEAKAICAGCPVQIECRDDALFNEDLGVRGGCSEDERIAITLARRRYNPYFQFDMEAAKNVS